MPIIATCSLTKNQTVRRRDIHQSRLVHLPPAWTTNRVVGPEAGYETLRPSYLARHQAPLIARWRVRDAATPLARRRWSPRSLNQHLTPLRTISVKVTVQVLCHRSDARSQQRRCQARIPLSTNFINASRFLSRKSSLHVRRRKPRVDENMSDLADFSGSLYRVLPVHGRFFISTNYFCFRSSALLYKTRVSRLDCHNSITF